MEKKTVLISGGTSGIGLASARLCARAGMNVVINGRNEERGLQALHEVEPFGNVIYVKGDVTVEDDCQRMVEAAVSTFGNLTGLVTSAGDYPQEILGKEKTEENLNEENVEDNSILKNELEEISEIEMLKKI